MLAEIDHTEGYNSPEEGGLAATESFKVSSGKTKCLLSGSFLVNPVIINLDGNLASTLTNMQIMQNMEERMLRTG